MKSPSLLPLALAGYVSTISSPLLLCVVLYCVLIFTSFPSQMSFEHTVIVHCTVKKKARKNPITGPWQLAEEGTNTLCVVLCGEDSNSRNRIQYSVPYTLRYSTHVLVQYARDTNTVEYTVTSLAIFLFIIE